MYMNGLAADTTQFCYPEHMPDSCLEFLTCISD